MSVLGQAVGMVAPLYNLGLVVIAVGLFVALFKIPHKNKRVFTKPWTLIFVALGVFIVEEVFTVLRAAQLLDTPRTLNGLFELVIIILFLYTLLVQREYVQKKYF